MRFQKSNGLHKVGLVTGIVNILTAGAMTQKIWICNAKLNLSFLKLGILQTLRNMTMVLNVSFFPPLPFGILWMENQMGSDVSD